MSLKARLGRYREAAKVFPQKEPVRAADTEEGWGPPYIWPGWAEAGFKTIKREITRELLAPIPASFERALAILIPDFLRLQRIPKAEELLFFDLETTGLSGGAGTLAFLAAFGRFSPGEKNNSSRINITQYLLLDYPGEGDFIESIVKEFVFSPPPLVVSYNGKSFDAQILKTRCLMNRIPPPELFHVDLLHPARRIWKRLLLDCSQANIEVSALGLDRTGDISGSLAPDIWFSFLRSGESSELLSVCEHNIRDITGLASIFLALGEIAEEPLGSRFRYDEGALALFWNKVLRKFPSFFKNDESCEKSGKLLLQRAAQSGHIQAAINLAIDAEWSLRDPALALKYTESALSGLELSEKLRDELEKRKRRLKKKIFLAERTEE